MGRPSKGNNGESIDKLRRLDFKAWKNRYPDAYAEYRRRQREYSRRITLNGIWQPGSAGRPPLNPSSDEYLKEKKA